MLKTNNEFIRFHFDKEYEIIPEKRSVEILPATHIKNFRVNSNNNNHINLSYSGNINNLNFSNFQNNKVSIMDLVLQIITIIKL